jgi:hypothetical protein
MFKKTIQVDYSKKIEELALTREVKLYKKYSMMNPFDYGELIIKWDEYYKKAKQSFPAQNYYAQFKAYKEGNMKLVKEFAEVAKLWLKEGERLETPSEEDPRVIEASTAVNTWKNIKGLNHGADVAFSL